MRGPVGLSLFSQECPCVLLFACPEDIRTTSDCLSERSLVQMVKLPRVPQMSIFNSRSMTNRPAPPCSASLRLGRPLCSQTISPCDVLVYICICVLLYLHSQYQLLRTTVEFPHWCWPTFRSIARDRGAGMVAKLFAISAPRLQPGRKCFLYNAIHRLGGSIRLVVGHGRHRVTCNVLCLK